MYQWERIKRRLPESPKLYNFIKKRAEGETTSKYNRCIKGSTVEYPEILQLRDGQTSSEDSLAEDTVEERSRALMHDWLDRPEEDDDFGMPE